MWWGAGHCLAWARAGLDLAPIQRCEEALRLHTITHVLGDEVLFDCDSDGAAPAGGHREIGASRRDHRVTETANITKSRPKH